MGLRESSVTIERRVDQHRRQDTVVELTIKYKVRRRLSISVQQTVEL